MDADEEGDEIQLPTFGSPRKTTTTGSTTTHKQPRSLTRSLLTQSRNRSTRPSSTKNGLLVELANFVDSQFRTEAVAVAVLAPAAR